MYASSNTVKWAGAKETFAGYLFHNRRDNMQALCLFIGFSVFYFFINMPFISYMKENAETLLKLSPFYGVPFSLNLFNFDPSFYYGYLNMTVTHPYLSFVAGALGELSKSLGGNAMFLFLQSALNGLSVAAIFYYLKRKEERKAEGTSFIPLLFAAFFGFSSYSIFSSLIPDSYVYAQFVLVLSFVYLAYSSERGEARLWPSAILGFFHFAITSTNIIPYMAALFIANVNGKHKALIRRWLLAGAIIVLFIILFGLIQMAAFDGKAWFTSWQKGIENGGFSYVAPFSFSAHWKSVYLMFINPVLTPDIVLVSPGIVAFASSLSIPYPLYVNIIGFSLLALAIAGFIRGIKTKEAWMLVMYVGAGIGLHLVIGFGLAVFQNDLYMYAGHFLFAPFLLAASFIIGLRKGLLKTIGCIVILIFTLTTAGHNIVKHTQSLDFIKDSYVQLEQTQAQAK
ncbi:DUF6080 domain-containing protein [Paenibacillus sp. GCM10027627]|uniref:DUF6080 domain-containing protein n=1 Tax=unclassified Paenibacillus TaxID=185978 RepID=UPI00362F72D7